MQPVFVVLAGVLPLVGARIEADPKLSLGPLLGDGMVFPSPTTPR